MRALAAHAPNHSFTLELDIEFLAHLVSEFVQTLPIGLLLESRGQEIGDPFISIVIGDLAFDALAHLDTHLPLFRSDDDEETVAFALLAQLPLLGHPNREVFNGKTLQAFRDEDRHLRPSLGMQLIDLIAKFGLLFSIK